MARIRKNRKGAGKKVFALIVDGETELWYFQMMKKHENLPKIDLKPELPKKKKLKEQFKSVLESIEKGYDKVFWILDFDTLIKEDKETRKGKQSAIQEFREYKDKLKKVDNAEVWINTPCLEFWLLLHFKTTSKFYLKCENSTAELKKYLSDYKKSRKYYTNSANDIFKRLNSHLETARQNAEKLGTFDFQNPQAAKAEIFNIFDEFKKIRQ